MGREDLFEPPRPSGGCRFGQGKFAEIYRNGRDAPIVAISRGHQTEPGPKGMLGAGSAGLAVGGAYLAVATGVDHLVDEFGVARQDASVDRTGGGGDLAVAAQ